MKTQQVLEILKVVAWILFFGLCSSTVVLILVTVLEVLRNQITSDEISTTGRLYWYSKWHFGTFNFLLILISVLKAYLFFLVVKLISGLNLSHPFSKPIARYLSKMSEIALQIGITIVIVHIYAKWLMKSGVQLTYSGGETEFLFLAGILFVIAQIFKRGIELQSENELTI
jgi:hypothetical protein